jgi:hypothetical protein
VTEIATLQKNGSYFILIIIITGIFFIFSNDGHRSTFDEDLANQEALRLVTLQPHPNYVQGESRLFFEYAWLFPPETNNRSFCNSGLLCSASNIGHSVTQMPFIFINSNLNIFEDVSIWDDSDFTDANYVYWKNTLNPDFVFLEIFYGPIISAITTGVFFLFCRSFNFSIKTSIITSFIFAFSTLIWSYSQTSLNVVPATLFILLGYVFFVKFTKTENYRHLFFCGMTLAFGFLVRQDTVIIASILFFYFILKIIKNKKIKILVPYSIPLIISYIFSQIISQLRFENVSTTIIGNAPTTYPTPFYVGLSGLLFSPGIGLFVFVPITLLSFLSFTDFYRKEKTHCILFLAIIISFLIYYSQLEFWHGLVSWGPRYLLPVIPFLILPIAASLETRIHKKFLALVIFLASLGFFINFVNIIQNVQWFIWGFMGVDQGLYALGRMESGNVYPLWINPLVIYTFEFSQLTHALIWSTTYLQPDIFFLKLLGTEFFFIILSIMVIVPIFLLFRQFKKDSKKISTKV